MRRRSNTTGSMMEILQQRRRNTTAPLQLYSSGILFPANLAKCQLALQESPALCSEQKCLGNPSLESKSRHRCASEWSAGHERSFYDADNLHRATDRNVIEPENRIESLSGNYSEQTDRKRRSQYEDVVFVPKEGALDYHCAPTRNRTCSLSERYFGVRAPPHVVRSVRWSAIDTTLSPVKHLSTSFPREHFSSVSSANTIQCVDAFDWPGAASDCNFNVSPDWSETAQATFRIGVLGPSEVAQTQLIDSVLLCGDVDENDDVFDGKFVHSLKICLPCTAEFRIHRLCTRQCNLFSFPPVDLFPGATSTSAPLLLFCICR